MPARQTVHCSDTHTGATQEASATTKSQQLLCEILPDHALQEYVKHGFFHHRGKANVYRMHEGRQTEIYCNGRLSATACLHLTVPAPSCDRMIAEYLILKNDEMLYWSKANIFPVNRRIFDPRIIIMGVLDVGLLLKLGLDYFRLP